MHNDEWSGGAHDHDRLPRLRVAGVSLEYRQIPGRHRAPVLVFLHSALGSARLWEEFPDRLVGETGLPAFAYSRQGHGASDPLPTTHDAGYLNHEALAVLPGALNDRGIERPILVGHSDGATISLIAAARSRIDPRALVLIAPHVIVETISVRGIEQTADRYANRDLRQKLQQHHDHVDGMFSRWSDVWRDPSFLDWTIVPLLADLSCPVLVIQGKDDRYGTLEQVRLIAENARGSVETLVLDDCGHAPQVDYPERVAEAIVGFVGRIDA